VLGAFGKTGSGHGEFLYPRPIARAPDGTLWVVDKGTGRLQHFRENGEFLGMFRMPQIESGKPTGLCVGPDGLLYVADTHYSRVMVFSAQGREIRRFGRHGTEDGCFIYPTDVAIAGDGKGGTKVFVSEFGGNDRVSVFTPQGEFLYQFGSPGGGQGELQRPAGMAVDERRGRLYVADACNHRIAVYDLEGRLAGYIGKCGSGPGELRYPYDVALREDGTILVCEYGNNRLQVLAPDGRCLWLAGGAGRDLGQLAYPWGVAAAGRMAFVVDAGNNRVQVWRLPACGRRLPI